MARLTLTEMDPNSTTLSAHGAMDSTRGAPLRVIALIALLAPLAYVATLFAVAAHEIVGHGFTAILLGGEFHGFSVRWDAMGWASMSLPPDAAPWHRPAVLAGGAISTMIAGAVFLLLAWRMSRFTFARMGLAIAASCFVLDGSMYMMWSGYQATTGDFGRIVQLTESGALRWLFVATGALFTVVFAYVPMAIVVRESNRWLWRTLEPVPWQRWLLPVLIGVAFAIGQFAFDWNQIAEGIGRIPNYWGLFFAAALAAALAWVRPDARPLPSQPAGILWPLAVTWVLTAGTLAIIALWLQEGIRW